MEHTLFSNRWYALKPSRLIKTKPVKVSTLGHNLVIWRNNDNQIVVQDNNCPHRGAELSLGKIKKRTCIECPYHGWTFDNDGLLQGIPADKTSKLISNVRITTYESLESGGLIWYCPGNPDGYHPPIIKEMMDKKWSTITGEDIFNNDWITSLENSIDITHVNFVHSDFGDSQNGEVNVLSLNEKSQDTIRMISQIHHKSDNFLLKFTENPAVRVKHDVLLPNTISIQFEVNDIMNVITYVTYTPLENNKTLLNWVFLRKPKIFGFESILSSAFTNGMIKALQEDKLIVESLVNQNNRISIPADSIQIKYRNMLKQMKLNEPSMDYEPYL